MPTSMPMSSEQFYATRKRRNRLVGLCLLLFVGLIFLIGVWHSFRELQGSGVREGTLLGEPLSSVTTVVRISGRYLL